MQRPLTTTLFPYTTLFRSLRLKRRAVVSSPQERSFRSKERRRNRALPCRCGTAWKKFKPGANRHGNARFRRSEEHTSELQSHHDLVCRLLLEKKKTLNRHY